MTDVVLEELSLTAGGGDFHLPCLSLGVFLNDQPTHRLAVGSDRRSHRPLARHQGWVLPAGSEGICEYDERLEVVIIAFEGRLLAEVGLERPDPIAPTTRSFDPLTLQLILGADAFLGGGNTLPGDDVARCWPLSWHGRSSPNDRRSRRSMIGV